MWSISRVLSLPLSWCISWPLWSGINLPPDSPQIGETDTFPLKNIIRHILAKSVLLLIRPNDCKMMYVPFTLQRPCWSVQMQILSWPCKSTICKYCAEVLRNKFSVICVNYKNLINILNMLVTSYFPGKRKYFFNFVSKMQLFCTANNLRLFYTINKTEYSYVMVIVHYCMKTDP